MVRLALICAGLGALLALSVPVAAEASSPPDSPDQSQLRRVIGGRTTTSAAYPWQVAIVRKDDGSTDLSRILCGGVLITPYIVLTAGHCTRQQTPTTIDVVAGRTALSSSGGYEDSIGAVHTSPSFEPASQRYDLGYLFLRNPIPLETIKLAGANEGSLWNSGRQVQITGWGTTVYHGLPSDTLRVADVGMISDAYCQEAWGVFSVASMVCAGFKEGGVDTCAGDSGGAMQSLTAAGGFRLVGLTSWGGVCAAPHKPGVYTRVGEAAVRQVIVNDLATFTNQDGVPYTAGTIVGSGAQPAAGSPANDEFAAAAKLTGGTTSAGGTNVYATKQAGEPDIGAGHGGASVWYRWTAPESGHLTVDLCNSSFDTQLAIYGGTSFASLNPIGFDDDGCTGSFGPSRATVHVIGGIAYRIAVDGFATSHGDPSEGGIDLQLHLALPDTPSFTSSGPASPANNNHPTLRGTAQAGTRVEIYTNPECSGQPLLDGSAEQFATDGIEVAVADDTRTTFRALVREPDNDISECSGPITYVEDSRAPVTTLVNVIVRPVDRSVKVRFAGSDENVEPAQMRFRCALDSKGFSGCSSPRGYHGLKAGSHRIRLAAEDEAGNRDASPLLVRFKIHGRSR